MKAFKTRYNYLILLLRCLSFLFSLGLYLLMLVYLLPQKIQRHEVNPPMVIGVTIYSFVFLFITFRFGRMIRHQRKKLTFQDNRMVVTDAILNKQTSVELHEIKGYSSSVYPNKIWNFKELIIYLKNGEKIELPQFLYFNFRNIRPVLEKHGIDYLGDEPYEQKLLGERLYKFDKPPIQLPQGLPLEEG